MRVLWLSPTPGNSLKRTVNNIVGGGWIISLENEIKSGYNLQLAVAYISETKEEPFVFESVEYYPIVPFTVHNRRINNLLKRSLSQKWQDKKVLPLILEVIDSFKPDIIHIHGTEASWGVCHKYIKNVPIVFSIQGLIAPYKEKLFSGISKEQAVKYESFIERIKFSSVLNEEKSFSYRAKREIEYLKVARYILGRTVWDKEVTLALNPNRKYYVVNEILREPFYRKKWSGSILNKKYQICSIISGGVYKGFETLLKAAHILKEYSNLDFEWNVIGYDVCNKQVKLSEKITTFDSKTNGLIFHGRLNSEQLAEMLCNSDLYCHVSHIENSPNSVCEAMILGLPIIATFAGGTSSILLDNKEGRLLQDGDPYALAGAIIALKNDFEKSVEYGRNARIRALMRHDKKRIADELVCAYKSILNDFYYDKK